MDVFAVPCMWRISCELDLFLKELAVLPEPITRLVHVGYLCLDDVPESRRMVGLQKVGQLMGDDVVNHKDRCLDQPPVQVDVVANCA